MAKKVAVILSGCGFLDGAEVQESVLTLLALSRAGAEVSAFAPAVPQAHVVNHAKGTEAAGEKRSVLEESARIVRGRIADLATANAAAFDAVVFPGGFGVAKNLCTYAFAGEKMTVLPGVEALIRAAHGAGKPMAFFCIAPVLAAKVISSGVELTIGNDPQTARHLETWGARHIPLPVTECHVDTDHRVVSAPAYMYDATTAQVDEGIAKGIRELLALLG